MQTILVVDDRAINRKFLSVLLSHADYRVLEAGDGAEALHIVQQEKVALVISDILMPVMDGIAFANHLHATPKTAQTPIIFYTATYRAEESRLLARACGVDTVLAKPAEPHVILDAVNTALAINVKAEETSDSEDEHPIFPLAKLQGYQSFLHAALRVPDLSESVPALKRTASDISLHAADNQQSLSLRTAALLELSMNLPLERDPQKLLSLFCRAAHDIMHAKCTAVCIGGNGQTKRFAHRNMCRKDVDAISGVLDAHAGPLHEILFGGNLLRTQSEGRHPLISALAPDHPLCRNALVVPILLSSHPYGWLYIADKSGADTFDQEDEQCAATLAVQLAPAYENLVLYEQVQRHAGELMLEIAERQQVTEALQESETRFRQLAENIRQVFFLINCDSTQVLYVSPAYADIWGRSCESLYVSPLSWLDHAHPYDKERAFEHFAARKISGCFDFEYRIVQPGGEIRAIRARGFPICDETGELHRFACIAEDITEQTAQARRIAHLSKMYAVLSGINSAIVRIHDRNSLFQEACRVAVSQGAFSTAWIGVVDPDSLKGEIVAWQGGETGHGENLGLTTCFEPQDSHLPVCVAVRDMRPVICNNIQIDPSLASHRTMLLARGHQSLAVWPLVTHNRTAAVLALFAAEADFFDGEQIKLLDELAGDLSFGLQFIEKEEKLDYLAYYDVLTALPNGALFHDRLSQFLHAARADNKIVAVVMIDLQNFAHLNDAMGRNTGDAVLKEVVSRLKLNLREPYSLARISGDRFAIAVAGLHRSTDVITILEQQIFEPFRRYLLVDRQEILVSMQAGLALYPDDGENAETLVSHAEVALKKAKASDEHYLCYAPQMNATVAARLEMETKLRIALEAEQFAMFYQPRVDLRTGRIVSAEALIRWNHPQLGQIPPGVFIPVAEANGLIVPIGAWAIDTVCAQQAKWLEQNVEAVPVAVNLSTAQFKNGKLLQTICDTIRLHGLETQYIEFELTESIVMNDPEEATHSLQALKAMGVRLALDDFGTGYSSLAYLKRFPFDFVKIDRAFISNITRSPEDAAIAIAVIAMAHSLNLRVVAEGVETEGQLQYLCKHHCDEMQGYYFSPPVPAAEFEAMLVGGKRLAMEREKLEPVATLLIVDDDPNILSALQRLLRRDGYKLLTATSGSQALELLATNTVQVIVSDQRMPDMSGAEFLGVVKGIYPDTIRIILSGYTDLEVIAESVNRGEVFKFLTKPWDDELLREQIRDAFRRYRPVM